MPVARNYSGGSIVYFQGDTGEEIYVLQKGRVILISTAIDTHEEIKEEVRLGEFFGVKSSLGKYPREETAQVLGKTTLLVFRHNEFEQLVMKNTRIIMKMLKVFSKNLRNIHRQVRDVLKADAVKDPAYELMNVAESFYRSGHIDYATYAFGKYLEYYPGGRYSQRAEDLLQMARKGMAFPASYPPLMAEVSSDKSPGTDFVKQGMMSAEKADTVDEDPFALNPGMLESNDKDQTSPLKLKFEEGIKAFKNENYIEALRKFKEIKNHSELLNPEDTELVSRAHFEKGRAELKLRHLDEASSSFSEYIKQFPTGDYVKESIYQLGIVAETGGDIDRAKSLFHKVSTMPPPDGVTGEARKRLQALG